MGSRRSIAQAEGRHNTGTSGEAPFGPCFVHCISLSDRVHYAPERLDSSRSDALHFEQNSGLEKGIGWMMVIPHAPQDCVPLI